MNNELTVKVETPTGHIRVGELPALIQRASYSFSGTLKAPYDYFAGKTSDVSLEDATFPKVKMVVEVSRSDMKILFKEDNLFTEGSAVITGQAYITKEISDLGINTAKKYTASQLGDKLRMSRLMFTSSDECLKIVTALSNFKARVEADLQTADDKKGNKVSHFGQTISQPHDLKFTLSWPVISGEPKVKFLVEINYDVRDKAIEFWLESVEMHEAINEGSEKLMESQIELFKAAGVTVIEQ